jgi:hypothetical protein
MDFFERNPIEDEFLPASETAQVACPYSGHITDIYITVLMKPHSGVYRKRLSSGVESNKPRFLFFGLFYVSQFAARAL